MDVKGLLKAVGEDGFLKHVSFSYHLLQNTILSTKSLWGLVITAISAQG